MLEEIRIQILLSTLKCPVGRFARCVLQCMKCLNSKGPFNNYVDKIRGGEGVKNICFCPLSGYKNCPRREGVKKWQNSVHVVVECPLMGKVIIVILVRKKAD